VYIVIHDVAPCSARCVLKIAARRMRVTDRLPSGSSRIQ
jgi:hypothetical protein